MISFANYHLPSFNFSNLAAAYQQHARLIGQPAHIKINPKNINDTVTWLQSQGLRAYEVMPDNQGLRNLDQLAAAVQAGGLIQIDCEALNTALAWLKQHGHKPIRVQRNGGTFTTELWIAAANGASS